jgi:type II secretory pathway pseudopilin PulG
MNLTTSTSLCIDAGSTLVTARTRRSREAGFTLIDMLFVVALIGLIASMAIPGLMRARSAAQSASALGSLRVINSAELSYAITCGLGFYAPDFPTLGVAPPGSPDAYLPADMAAGFTFIKSGYNFSLAGTPLPSAPGTCNGLVAGMAAPGYAVVADPLDPMANASRFFGTNSVGVIYQHNATLSLTMPESSSPPAGGPIQ